MQSAWRQYRSAVGLRRQMCSSAVHACSRCRCSFTVGAGRWWCYRQLRWVSVTNHTHDRQCSSLPHVSAPPSRQSSSWPSGMFKSASEYLFSDTLDEKVQVGVDDAGNRYFEVVRTFRADNSKQALRIVEPAAGIAAVDYDPTSVPPQWQSWLSYSRRDPPTTTELSSTADASKEPAPSDRTVRL